MHWAILRYLFVTPILGRHAVLAVPPGLEKWTRIARESRWDLRHSASGLCIFVVSLMIGCTSPSSRFTQTARSHGFIEAKFTGPVHGHSLYLNRWPSPTDVLHVYLGGDGSPWIRGRWISHDPTPRRPVTLELMALDPSPAVYVGRPCYHGAQGRDPAACDPQLWTSHRYSDEVVASLHSAIDYAIDLYDARGIVLIGYSGGGVLALSLAQERADVLALLTIAANLHVRAWTAYHGYLPLQGRNPAQGPALPGDVYQLHLTGGRDQAVPPRLTHLGLERQPGVEIEMLAGFDHRCCWTSIWESVLHRLPGYAR
jgi:pimeloyl-ACP methyl ester carboxylesterase